MSLSILANFLFLSIGSKSSAWCSAGLVLRDGCCPVLGPFIQPGQHICMHLIAVGLVQNFMAGAGVYPVADVTKSQFILIAVYQGHHTIVRPDRIHLARNDKDRQILWECAPHWPGRKS